MTLLNPTFLFALFALAVPLIIHLYNFRRYKTLYFSNVKFLKNISQETRASSQLRHWLILLARMLAIASLVIAFSQPIIPLGDKGEQTNQSVAGIYLDNSFSMEGEGSEGKLLEMARNKARKVVSAFRPGTRFLFTTNDFDPQHQHLVSRDQVLDFIANTSLSSLSRPLSDIYLRQKDYLKQNLPTSQQRNLSFFISDFQKSTSDFGKIKADSALGVRLIPLETQSTNNLFIDSCWFTSPYRQFNQPDEIRVRIVNAGDQAYSNIPLKLFFNDSLKSVSSFSIAPGERIETSLAFSNTSRGWINARIELTDYPVTFDNQFYFSFRIAEKIDIHLIGRDASQKYLRTLFADDPYFSVSESSETNLDLSSLAETELLILNGILELSSGQTEVFRNFVAGGGSLVFFPAVQMERNSVNNFLEAFQAGVFQTLDTTRTVLSEIAYQSSLYRNSVKELKDKTDFPIIFRHFPLTLPATGAEQLLSNREKHPILIRKPFQKGQVFIFSIPLGQESSNLVKHPLFVPSLLNMALQSLPPQKEYYTLGIDESIDIQSIEIGNSEVLRIKGFDSEFDLIPETRRLEGVLKLFIQQHIKKAGNFLVTRASLPVSAFSFNYNRAESDLEFFETPEIKNRIKEFELPNFSVLDVSEEALPQSILKENQGTPLWKWFILAALFFLAMEILIARLFRKKSF